MHSPGSVLLTAPAAPELFSRLRILELHAVATSANAETRKSDRCAHRAAANRDPSRVAIRIVTQSPKPAAQFGPFFTGAAAVRFASLAAATNTSFCVLLARSSASALSI